MTTPPSKRELRSALFWSARWLLGGAEFHRGPLLVAIEEEGQTLILRPREGEELFDADNGPDGGGLTELAPQLLASLVSADGLAILRLVATRGPVASKVIVASAGIERCKCYVLLGDLRDRGLIADRGEGYEIADAAVWEAVRRRATDDTDGTRSAA
jgi:hypothetical protein